MTFDLWTHQYCLACDKQVHIEGAAYCSEACRLSDFETTSCSSSQASSPTCTPSAYPWATASSTTPARTTPTKFYLSPAYDFSNAQPYGSTPSRTTTISLESTVSSGRNLTPSSSHSSLCSMQSNSTTGESTFLSDKAKQELRAYAVSFEQVRTQRRRSY